MSIKEIKEKNIGSEMFSKVFKKRYFKKIEVDYDPKNHAIVLTSKMKKNGKTNNRNRS